ncbi:hypothetical protein FRC11_004223 [Ceratobasidium sp. 423]|nr:hypothetical protein FRC11_004223 [Ceratobasidium sp. 423]
MAKAFMSLFDGPSTHAHVTKAMSSAEAAAVAAVADMEDPNNEPDVEDSTTDIGVVLGISAEACTWMEGWGVTVSASELASSHQVIPKIAGLARQVNDSPTLETLFQDYLLAIVGHIHFKGPVKWMTGHDHLKLKKYALTDPQWGLPHQLSEVLEIFREPTEYFSQAKVPLVHKVLPQLLALQA